MKRGIALRIALIAVLVMVVAVAAIAIGVLVVAQTAFSRLMMQAGHSADEAQAMFNESIAVVFAIAAIVGAALGIGLAFLLATRLAAPLREMAGAARQLARGQLATRVNPAGPEEITSLALSFNQMAETLEEQERMRREFIVNAAHELSTPLTNLQGYLEAMRDGVIAPSTEQFQSLQEEVERLIRLSRSLQTLAAEDASRAGDEKQTLDLVPALRSAVELARPAFEAKRITLELDVPTQLMSSAHPDGLAQIVSNLLQNAARYTPEGGTVQITAEKRHDDALVSVNNTGQPIPANDLPHVFERFYRVEKSRDRARGGAGIGLAIVKELVERSGGEVGVRSDNGTTRFWFSLPSAGL